MSAQLIAAPRIDTHRLAAEIDATRAAARHAEGVPSREHRRRDFGIGYGRSSGYASARRYADNWGNARFTCG